jgi:hypothetical protein
MLDNTKKIRLLKPLFIFVIIFGLLTLIEGGSVAFDIGDARVKSGNYVPFVLWFNFLSGFVYIINGVGLLLEKKWASKSSFFLLISILIVYFLLLIHILLGGLYETKTVIAMGLRSSIWALTFFASLKMIAWKKKLVN